MKQAENLLKERAQNVNRLFGEKLGNLSLNIEKKTPVEMRQRLRRNRRSFLRG
ncbi:hypothetical protein QUF99_13935 [Bacillus sp. DX4.1]|uniref:hypothetical protein n=1 Tax=Bacillus sp. DX4.1 TaxID=3055867 RepID=UPI0025A06202|nr:hypothetical protein [Bacillus sp. DX4.1]MDM5188378.1 hypothetical protein [Bacillus sp. DX4.1]